MSSMLMKCPECSVMIAKGHPCPDCHWSPVQEEQSESPGNAPVVASARGPELVAEYNRRERNHTRNYTIFMGLMLATGLVGLLTAFMWIRFIYRGSINAFIYIIFLSIVTSGLGVALKLVKRWFPVDLSCPSCDARLDQIGLMDHHCPSCSMQLK